MPIDYTANLGALDRWKNDLAMRVRRKVFRQFWRVMKPTREMRVADFGVSGHRDHPAHYFFETLYPWKDRLTAIGQAAENADWMPEQFPGLTFLEADLREIPLPDNYFDIGICNAVVEHAGTYDQQVALVHEVCRVSRKVMFTTPNKDFPVEVHTFVPLAHWLPDPQFRAVLRRLGPSRPGPDRAAQPARRGDVRQPVPARPRHAPRRRRPAAAAHEPDLRVGRPRRPVGAQGLRPSIRTRDLAVPEGALRRPRRCSASGRCGQLGRRAPRGSPEAERRLRPLRERSRSSTNSRKIVPITLFRLCMLTAFERPVARSSMVHGTAT